MKLFATGAGRLRRAAVRSAAIAALVAALAGSAFAAGPTLSTLFDFPSLHADGLTNTDGCHLWAGLTIAGDGETLYGVATDGGKYGSGTLFSITESGVFKVLHTFSALSASTGTNVDGAHPYASLSLGSDGLLYGTTDAGGAGGTGTLFSFNPVTGKFQRLFSFGPMVSGINRSGADPCGGIILGSDGQIYGTTFEGGTSGDGTVFRVVPNRSCTVLNTFERQPKDGVGAPTGIRPYSALLEYPAGTIWGSASLGGQSNHGVIFSIDMASGAYTLVHTFAPTSGQGWHYGNPDGADVNGFVPTPAGNVVATTAYGGNGGTGTIVALTTAGAFSVVYMLDAPSTSSINTDGAFPSQCAVDSAGDVFFTTCADGADGHGQLDEYTSAGSLVVLSQIEPTQGSESHAAPTIAPSGAIYGDTTDGGPSGTGSIFVYQ